MGFTLPSLLLAVVAPGLAVMLPMADRPPGPWGASIRLLEVAVLSTAAVLSIGPWRCERWVGKVVVAWAALMIGQSALEHADVIYHVRSPAYAVAAFGLTLLPAAVLGAAVWYVRRRTLDLWPTP